MARAMGIAAAYPMAPMMAMVISPIALCFLAGLYHAIFDPVGSVSSLCLICSSSLIRKSLCLSSVAQAEFSVQNASSIGFMADLMCECMPAMVLSHSSFALSSWDVLPKVRKHWSMLKKAASRSSIASLKSFSSPPKFVKNDTLATSLTHICIGIRPLLSFF